MQAIELWLGGLIEDDEAIHLPQNFDEVYAFHKSMDAYAETPLIELKSLASTLNVKGIFVKDESHRFGLNAFKGLGVSYALDKIIGANKGKTYTFVSCTDGNHGKALAWRANQLGHKAVIFMPKGSERRRVEAIEAHSAEVIVTEMNYDDTVRHAASYARENGYYLVQDTALPDNVETANDIVMGYTTMVREAIHQITIQPTHVFLQAGVGSMAGGVIWFLCNQITDMMPQIGVIESSEVACIYESVKRGRVISIGGEPFTIMAGLNCGEANFITYPLLKAKGNYFLKCRDEITVTGMRRARNPVEGDVAFSAGESGAVGLGLIEEVLSNPEYETMKRQLNLDENSVILIFNTEGDLENGSNVLK